MERLTVRNSEGIGVLKQPYECEKCGDLQWSLPDLGNGSPIDRLAEYEEIGTVDEFKKALDNVKTLSGMYEKLNDQEVAEYHKLAEYEKLDVQGKLLKLRCAVGDTVYKVHRGIELVYECKVVGVKQEHNTLSVKLYTNINEKTYSIWVDDWFDECQIGRTVFLTQEAAEAALRNRKG